MAKPIQACPSLKEGIETLSIKIPNALQITALAEGAEDLMSNFCGYQ